MQLPLSRDPVFADPVWNGHQGQLLGRGIEMDCLLQSLPLYVN